MVYGLRHQEQCPSPSRACHGLWTTVQCAHGGVSRDIREWPSHGTNLLRLGLWSALSLGAIQKVLDRVAQAIEPHYTTIASQARQAPVNYIDETPWFLTTTWWLWVMVSDRVAFYLIHPRRSKEAFAALIDDWAGLLVSDGYGVYQTWVAHRQTCLAHLIRTARSLAARQQAELAACGTWALAELQRLCHMATAPPTGGEWRAWYARLCKLIDQYHDRPDDAGRLARRLLREVDSLWVFLVQSGVEPTNNRAERALRFGVLWRKRSLGTASEKRQPLGGAHLVAQGDLPSPGPSDLCRAGGCRHLFLPWPTTRSLLAQRGGEPRSSLL